jgi:Holliday junction resolvase RusA-like endonuclease
VISIFVSGRIPSKKNQKVFNIKRRMLFSSKNHQAWEKAAKMEVAQQMNQPAPLEETFLVELTFNLPDNRACDLTNRAESVMDLLVLCGVLKDDCWQVVPRLVLSGMREKDEKVGCLVEIYAKESEI